MLGSTNSVAESGYAKIVVILQGYTPENMELVTITCTNGSTTLTKTWKPTGSQHVISINGGDSYNYIQGDLDWPIFYVPFGGTWTVQAYNAEPYSSDLYNSYACPININQQGVTYIHRISCPWKLVSDGIVSADPEPVKSVSGIVENKNANGEDVTDSFCTPNSVHRWSTRSGTNKQHVYVQWYIPNLSNYNRIIYDCYGFGDSRVSSSGSYYDSTVTGGFGILKQQMTATTAVTPSNYYNTFSHHFQFTSSWEGPVRRFVLDFSSSGYNTTNSTYNAIVTDSNGLKWANYQLNNKIGSNWICIHWARWANYNVYNDVRNLWVE